MIRTACSSIAAAFLIFCAVPAFCQQYYLYSPAAVPKSEKPAAKTDGVLVREVAVEKGDTLFGISRRFNGRGSYYPQILLFNDLKNPHLIHPGDTLKIPVSTATGEEHPAAKKRPAHQEKSATPVSAVQPRQPSAAKASADPVTEISLSELKRLDGAPSKKRSAKRSTVEKKDERPARQPLKAAARRQISPQNQAEETPVAGNGQGLYEQAVKAYRQEDFRSALDLFDRFLAANPSSPLAADASLYKAESYLKLSGQ